MSDWAPTMNDVVLAGFRGAVQSLESELKVMPLSRWNESVLRYFFCRALATAHEHVEHFVECGKIDLVLSHAALRAFIEFKFYAHPIRFDPYGRGRLGLKGGPSRKNLGEFRACIDQLHAQAPMPGLSKYVVLVYADPADQSHPRLRYSEHYDDYQHWRNEVPLRHIETAQPIRAYEAVVRARLFEVGPTQ